MTVALSLALVFNALSLALLVRPVSGDTVDTLSVEMSRQEISNANTSLNIEFDTPTGVDASTDTITVTFAAGFTLTGILFGDVDIEEDTVDKTVAAAAGAGVWGYALAGQVMTFTAPTDAASGEIDVDDTVNIRIGSESGSGITVGADGGTNGVTNPVATGSYDIAIGGTFGDDGTAYVPILDDDFVTINADVETHIQFDIDIDDIGELLAGDGHNTDDDASYSIDLGNLIFTDVTDEDSYTTTIGESNDGDHSNDGVDEIYFDLSTNATGGAVIDVYAAAAELTSASTGGSIPSATEVLATDDTDGGWGLACDEQEGALDGTLDVNTPFDVHGTPDSVGAVPAGVWDNIFDTNDLAIQDGDGTCAVRAVAGNQTLAADDYTNTLYFRATATF